MAEQRPPGGAPQVARRRRGAGPRRGSVAFQLRDIGTPNAILHQFDFWDDHYESRRRFAELFGSYLLVLVAVGSGVVNAKFGGHAVPASAQVVAPGLMVGVVILFMGAVAGPHLDPAVSVAFALRGDFPWKRVPAYVVAQLVGAVLAMLLLWGLVGQHGSAGMTLPGHDISTTQAMLWELVLSVGLVSTILGTASGAQALGPIAAIGVGSYIALAGLWGAPVSGASMNPARSVQRWSGGTGTRRGPTSRARSPVRSSPSASPTCCAGPAVA